MLHKAEVYARLDIAYDNLLTIGASGTDCLSEPEKAMLSTIMSELEALSNRLHSELYPS